MSKVLSHEIKQYLHEHENDNPAKVALNSKGIEGYTAAWLANQIDCRQRAKEKLPSWHVNLNIVYPPKQNLEQCSSEVTAQYKCDYIKKIGGSSQTIIDLTGGFGVDTYFFSKIFNKVIHIEPNEALLHLAMDSHKVLGARNIIYHNQTAEQFIQTYKEQADWIFIDPSRKRNGKKIFMLQDSEPNVLELLTMLWRLTENILIKTSPLLDIKEGLHQLLNTHSITVVAANNECKELLYYLKHHGEEPFIQAIDLPSSELYGFKILDEEKSKSQFTEPLSYLYEPNVAILKSGAFKKVGNDFGLLKLAVSTHLYTSSNPVEKFPGRVFRVLGEINELDLLPNKKANIISRNHPLTPDAIKKKYKLKDGGDRYVIACSSSKKKYLLIAERLQ